MSWTMDKPVLTIVGPTAVGKTALSIKLAEQLNGEIISVDSRQIYHELNIGTAKPTAAELSRIPHHLISERGIHQPVSAGQYAKLCEERIADVLSRKKTPLVVGGSTLYLHALQFGLSEIPTISAGVRDTLNDRLKHEGIDTLFNELVRLDPESARTMDSTKSQRIIRALEVFHGTGKPLSHYHTNLRPPAYKFQTIVLTRSRINLYERIEKRVDVMIADGLVEEVKQLTQLEAYASLPVLKTIGYQEIFDFLSGAIDYDEAIRLVKRNSRRYAKRQLTWFRRFPEYAWLDVENTDAIKAICSTYNEQSIL